MPLLPKIISKTFLFWQRFGIHVLPAHFYQPIPDTRKLRDLWSKPSAMVGVHLDAQQQQQLLDEFARWKSEYDLLPTEPTPVPHQYYVENGAFQRVDGEVLYCMVRHLAPRKMIEIGSGSSSYLTAQAILKNGEKHPCEFTCIEPYPNDVLRRGFPGLTRLVESPVQDVPLSTFEALEENDILFIDSSHVAKAGSDVQYEYLEIIPRLKKGVVIHVHDIFLPWEYPKRWLLEEQRFWNEQYLLQAFLAFNDSFEVLWAGNFMHVHHSHALEKAFSSYRSDGPAPGSFWIRRVR
jgi:predicted O-methyltransferase YrrM